MKYPTVQNQVRRFQIRMTEKADFFEALKMLNLANVPTEAPRSRHPKNGPVSSQTTSTHRPAGNASQPVHAMIPPLRPDEITAPTLGTTSTEHRKYPLTLWPSTAPVTGFKNLDAVLPPVRQLPFMVSEHNSTSSAKQNALATTSIPKLAGQPPQKLPPPSPKTDKCEVRARSNYIQEHEATDISHDRQNTGLLSSEVLDRSKADDIDTQVLFSKLEARRSRSSKKKQDYAAPPSKKTHPQPGVTPPPQSKGRNFRCDHCRTKKQKCDKLPDDVEGRCRPCLDTNRECTYKLVSELKSFSQTNTTTGNVVLSSKSKDTSSQAVQPKRVLRSNKALLSQTHSSLLEKDAQVKSFIAPTEAGTVIKRSTESHDTTLRKRIRTTGQKSATTAAKISQPSKTTGRRQQVLKTSKKSAKPKPTSRITLPFHPYSDGTTTTEDTDDLDRPTRSRVPLAETPNPRVHHAVIRSDCPTYSDLSEPQHEQDNNAQVANQQLSSEEHHSAIEDLSRPTKDPHNSRPNSRNPSCDMALSAFTKLEENARTEGYVTMLRHAIQSDKFLQVCKDLDKIWQAQIATSKI
ncbi:hypothetical protein LTR64_003098 [Lithohypha guttulata]|uniref:uncharacterized protein n=1 Tax=Lithohypha guttulata TaxID=1690604 RepID=UPI00315C933F